MQTQNIEDNKIRISKLKREISNTFDHLAEDEIEILENDFEKSTTRMIDIVKIGKKSVTAFDLSEDIEFSPILFPNNILELLRKYDKFFTTMGFRNGKWEIIFLSPPYNENN